MIIYNQDMSEAPLPMPAEPPLPAAAAAVTEESGTPVPPLGFWRQPFAQNVLPFIASIAIHLGIFIVLIATYQAAGRLFRVVQEQIVIPDASLAPDAGGVPNPGIEQDRQSGQNGDSSVTESSGFSQVKANLNNFSLLNSPTGGPLDASPLLPGIPTDGGLRNSATGALAQFGNPGAGSAGPHGKVFGHGGNATRIVYICDASGSMLSKMDLLKLELQKSVQDLSPVQAFDVIFFNESFRNHTDPFAPDLMMASAANKRKLYGFLQDIVGEGDTYVIPALTTAFNLPTRPELIYLLTDGAFEEETGPAVIQAIAHLNTGRRVKVNPVLLLGDAKDIDADEIKDARQAMQRIARENGGVYNEVSIDELGN
jgi:hypothetical protein